MMELRGRMESGVAFGIVGGAIGLPTRYFSVEECPEAIDDCRGRVWEERHRGNKFLLFASFNIFVDPAMVVTMVVLDELEKCR